MLPAAAVDAFCPATACPARAQCIDVYLVATCCLLLTLPNPLQFADWERGDHLQSFVQLAWPTFNRMICGWVGGGLGWVGVRPLQQLPGRVESWPLWLCVSVGVYRQPPSGASAYLHAAEGRSGHLLCSVQHHQAGGGGAAGNARRVWPRLLCPPLLRKVSLMWHALLRCCSRRQHQRLPLPAIAVCDACDASPTGCLTAAVSQSHCRWSLPSSSQAAAVGDGCQGCADPR